MYKNINYNNITILYYYNNLYYNNKTNQSKYEFTYDSLYHFKNTSSVYMYTHPCPDYIRYICNINQTLLL